MKLAEAIRITAERMLHQQGSAHPLEVREHVKAEHADLIHRHFDLLIDQRLLEMSRNVLRPSAAEQEQFPGFGDLPKTYTVPDGEGDVRYVHISVATLRDEAADLDVKRNNLTACQAEFDKAETRHQRLWAVPGACDDMPVLEAAQRVASGERRHLRRVDPGDAS